MVCCKCCCECTPTAPGEPPAAPPPSLPGCLGQYQTNGFTWTFGRANDPLPETGDKPAVNAAFLDPAYQTCIKRLTDHATDPPQGFARHYYSRRQAFNANNTVIHIVSHDGKTHLYDALTHTYIKEIPLRMDSEIIWDDTDPFIFYHTDQFGGDKLYRYNIETDADDIIADFSFRWPLPGVSRAWTRGEGTPSVGQRYWCFQLENDDFEFQGVMVFDRVSNVIVSSKSGADLGNTSRPDHVSMSPTGDWCVVAWLDEVVRFDRNLENRAVLTGKSEHSDIVLMSNNTDSYISVDYQSNAGDVFSINLQTLEKTVYFPAYIEGTSRALHFSGKATDKKDWVVMSAYANSGADQWIDEKIIALNLVDGTIVNIAFHRSIFNGYWTEAQATPDRQLERLVFSSNWGVDHQTDVDCYVVTLPTEFTALLNRRETAAAFYRLVRPSLEGR